MMKKEVSDEITRSKANIGVYNRNKIERKWLYKSKTVYIYMDVKKEEGAKTVVYINQSTFGEKPKSG